MTTEIAILNKSAVALAADSAVTISSRSGHGSITKIYVDANKLFELIKGAPVGVMIYNSAEIAGIPWETLVKSYRDQRRLTRFERLDQYVDDFLHYVETVIPQVVGPDGERELVHALVGNVFAQMYGQIMPFVASREPNKLKRRALFSTLLDQIDTQMSALPLQDWADGLDEAELQARWGAEVLAAIPSECDEMRFPVALRKKFARVLLRVLLRHPHQDGIWSGLVICGFGNDEMFPGVFHCTVAGFVEGRLVRVRDSLDRIDSSVPAIIQPYAQTDEAVMFLQGIDPTVSNAVSSFWETWATDLHSNLAEIVKAEVPKVTTDQLKKIRSTTRTYMNESWKAFSSYMDQEFHRRRMEPIEASAAFLSKREIADLAENLVELTSLRNRVSLDRQETVGGATDVAVISKGDGFVWVKRKHYFSHDRNPSWAMQQSLADVVSKLEAPSESGVAEE